MNGVLVDNVLSAVRVVDIVESEGLVGPQPGLRLPWGLGDADLAGVDDLLGQLRPDPDGDFDAAAAAASAAVAGVVSHL